MGDYFRLRREVKQLLIAHPSRGCISYTLMPQELSPADPNYLVKIQNGHGTYTTSVMNMQRFQYGELPMMRSDIEKIFEEEHVQPTAPKTLDGL